MEGPDIAPGDVIRVIDDMAEVHRLQKDSHSWADDMVLVCVYTDTQRASVYIIIPPTVSGAAGPCDIARPVWAPFRES